MAAKEPKKGAARPRRNKEETQSHQSDRHGASQESAAGVMRTREPAPKATLSQ
jgi:hypothetical protein